MLKPITGTTWRLTCDDCHKATTVRGTLAFSAFQEAARHGWHTAGRLDLCRACAKAAAEAKKRPARRR